MQQEAVENELASLLRKNSIPVIVMRGNDIAKEIYNDANCRTSSDIDFLIQRKNAVKADSILSQEGYKSEIKTPFKYCLSRIHHAAYRHSQNNMVIEMHWNFGLPYFFRLTSEEIWNEVIFTDSGQPRLSSEMIVIMLLIHHHSHSFRELKILVDILWALHKYKDEIDWYTFTNKLRKVGLIKTTQITLHQIQRLWNQSPDEIPSINTLEQAILTSGHKDPKFLKAYFRMDVDRDYHTQIYKDKLVSRFALDRRVMIILSFFKTVFPVPQAIKELYGDMRNWTLPFNYLRFIRWRVKEWTR